MGGERSRDSPPAIGRREVQGQREAGQAGTGSHASLGNAWSCTQMRTWTLSSWQHWLQHCSA